MTETLKAVALVIAGAVIGMLVSESGIGFGGVYNQVTTDFADGITVDGTTIISGSGALTATDGTFSGGTLNVTTSNTATSTVVGGCFQFYATSTATAHKFQASTTPGAMYSQYGTCPNL